MNLPLNKIFIKYLLLVSWRFPWGTRIKYHLKKTPFSFKRVGWSIKVYEVKNNILQKKSWQEKSFFNWTSINCANKCLKGVADPFLIEFEGNLYMFFEAIGHKNGEIWVGKYLDGNIKDLHCVLSAETHLSYPYVFIENEGLYMVPESSEEGTVKLFTSKKILGSWELDSVLYYGKELVDTNLLKHKGHYYWFTFDLAIKKSRLFFSRTLRGKWEEHPCSPFNSNRNAGAFIFYKKLIIRPVQISVKTYGEGVMLNYIKKLSTHDFEEAVFKSDFLIKEKGFNLDGTHHFSSIDLGQKSILAIDGKNNNFYQIE